MAGSDALIRNLLVNTEGPVHQLVLDQSIKMLVTNSWVEKVGPPVSCRQASRLQEERDSP